MKEYSYENKKKTGTVKKLPFTHGTELECNQTCNDVTSLLNSLGWAYTEDCTVEAEYKSPIQNGLASLSKTLKSLDNYAINGLFSTEDSEWSTCGTHANIGLAGLYGSENARVIRTYYHKLIMPLSNEMLLDNEKVERVFGRGFTHYAQSINENTNYFKHENFINVTKDECIEFRLCKYHAGEGGAQKYINTVKCCRKIFTLLYNASVEILASEDVFEPEEMQVAIAEKYGEKIRKAYVKM